MGPRGTKSWWCVHPPRLPAPRPVYCGHSWSAGWEHLQHGPGESSQMVRCWGGGRPMGSVASPPRRQPPLPPDPPPRLPLPAKWGRPWMGIASSSLAPGGNVTCASTGAVRTLSRNGCIGMGTRVSMEGCSLSPRLWHLPDHVYGPVPGATRGPYAVRCQPPCVHQCVGATC